MVYKTQNIGCIDDYIIIISFAGDPLKIELQNNWLKITSVVWSIFVKPLYETLQEINILAHKIAFM